MRFNFDIGGDNSGSLTPKEELQWVPLQNHPIFSSASSATFTEEIGRFPRNLTAWDGASKFYYWDSLQKYLHCVSIRLGEPQPNSILATSTSKVLQADVPLTFAVNKIAINRNGSALLLAGSNALCVMYLYGRSSGQENVTVCRTVSIGSDIYFNTSNAVRLVQASWHPCSSTHLAILSSDSVFRLFDLSMDFVQPEQEYYLQPAEPGRSMNASSICAVDYCFGGDHLWDRFSVFLLFADGSVYILCPVVPFGSVHKWESVLEIYSDAHTFGLESTIPTAVNNSNLAISWLEATFPELAQQELNSGSLSVVKAHPYALLDASLALQGPLRKVCHGDEDETLAVRGAECEGSAGSLLYNLVSKDSLLVTAWSGGQLQIDALADEIQPVWVFDSPPRLRTNSHDQVIGLAMICESTSSELSIVQFDQRLHHTVWLGHPPPLLRLAVVDLALPEKTDGGSVITLFVDPLMPERIYSLHDWGIDSTVLHFLPFTSQTSGKDDTVRSPSVHPVLSTCQGAASSPSPLLGLVPLSDVFGYSWIVAVTSPRECIVVEMKTWDLLPHVPLDTDKILTSILEGGKEIENPHIISNQLLSGPRAVLVPQPSPNPISVDSIEGRSILHQYFKLFHENYVEYAHKVYFELKHHGSNLKRIIDDQHSRVNEAQQKMLKVEKKHLILDDRIQHAIQQHNSLEQRLQRLSSLPGEHKKPLSRAEQEFKSELDQFTGVELDALHSSIEALRGRLRRYNQSPNAKTKAKANFNKQLRQPSRRNNIQDSQIAQLQSSIAKLSLVNSENSKKVKLVESALQRRERNES